jgi:capsular polysaccharide export protein
MYGDYITLHRLALAELQRHPQVSTGIFELGYARPHFITLETVGVNARSGLPRDPHFYRGLPAPAPDCEPSPAQLGLPFRRSQRLRLGKAGSFIVHAFQRYSLLPYPHKLQPRPFDLWAQYLGILRGLIYRLSEAPVRQRLRSSGRFVLVALQVASDSQIQESSPYGGMQALIAELTASFAAHAPAGLRLVFKHHPRDRGYNHYGRLIAELRRRHGIRREQLLYLHDAPLAPLLASDQCRGLITVSSTVALQALVAGVPVKLMGDTFFDLAGLVDQAPLEQFWRQPTRPEPDLWQRFYRYMLETTQFQGNFDGWVDFKAMLPVRPPLPVPG